MPYLIDIIVADSSWDSKKIESLVHDVAVKTLGFLDVPADKDICIKLSSDAEIKELNKIYRNKNTSTNVLSFPALALSHQPTLGDIILAFETVEKEAIAQHKKFDHHLAHLIVHGVLHLLGYDHEKESDALKMEALESQLLEFFTIKDPYKNNE